jgi:hypothetical protein
MKLQSMPYASAHVNRYSDGSVDLISYVTRVISIDKNGWLECTGTYSATTRKHIGAFMRNEVSAMSGRNLNYYTAKRCYEDNVKMNIYTGEVIPV